MKEKKRLDWWCHRAWIKFSCGITMVVMLMILINWQNWSTELKFIASIAVLIPIHVVEESVFLEGVPSKGVAKKDPVVALRSE